MKNNNKVSLLYFYGYAPLDKLMEEKYQGEDMYIQIFSSENKLIFEIDNFSYEVDIKTIKFIDLQYIDSLISFKIGDDECLFSFDEVISKELLELLFSLNVEKNIPKYLKNRYEQYLENDGLFDLVLKLKEELPPNDFLHFYPFIDEMALTGIVESFAPEAITEVPLMYIKYLDNEDKELGLLITSKKMYSPEKSILLKNINTIAYEEHFNITDSIDLYVNSEFFSDMKLIIWDRSIVSLSSAYLRVFKPEDFFNLIKEISNFVINKSSNIE